MTDEEMIAALFALTPRFVNTPGFRAIKKSTIEAAGLSFEEALRVAEDNEGWLGDPTVRRPTVLTAGQMGQDDPALEPFIELPENLNPQLGQASAGE